MYHSTKASTFPRQFSPRHRSSLAQSRRRSGDPEAHKSMHLISPYNRRSNWIHNLRPARLE